MFRLIINLSNYKHFLGMNIRFSKPKAPILCETYRFTSLGAFLYFELFKCIEEKFMPVKCRNCGLWFIMKHTSFSHYCKRLISSIIINTNHTNYSRSLSISARLIFLRYLLSIRLLRKYDANTIAAIMRYSLIVKLVSNAPATLYTI